MYKLHVFCPDKQKTIDSIIDAASTAGAGIMGNYTHCAFIIKGTGQWKPEPGAHPTIGTVGAMSQIAEVKIEMQCPDDKVDAVDSAIRKVHPYEEPAIEFLKLYTP